VNPAAAVQATPSVPWWGPDQRGAAGGGDGGNLARAIFKPVPGAARRGLLVAVEGLDGSGKTTVARGVHRRLRDAGLDPVLSNWNDTTEIYNLMMRLNAAGDLSTHERCIFSSVELAARYHYVIRPALAEGRVVLVMKYVVSALAHSIVRGHDQDFLRRLYDFAYEPDLTVYLDISPQEALARKTASGSIGFWEAGLDLALDLPLAQALEYYASGRLPAPSLARSFEEFQALLAARHTELLPEHRVLRLDAQAPAAQLIEQTTSAITHTLSELAAAPGRTESGLNGQR
jgi:thymidylate kinase